MVKKSKSKQNYSMYKYPVIGVLIIAAVIGFILAFKHHKNVSVIPAKNPAGNSSKTSQSDNTQGQNQKSSSSTGFSSPSENNQNSGNSELLVPSGGTLVSNHRPSLSGGSSPSSEQSVCNTSPGASCYIQFEKGSEVKKLPTETTDSSGSAYWSWNVANASLSTGSWKITAVASLNGQSKSFSDSLTLDVQP